MRNVVFLNHATPEENQFTGWLAAKLTLAGYEVWCDFHRLRGGQDFWNVIEDTIRHKTARFVAITSKISQTKTGVQNELALALTIEREIPDFVIPVRIDDLDFNQLKITVLTKNVIDFYGNWQKGLSDLLTTLSDARVPKTSGTNISKVLPWIVPKEQIKITVRQQKEILETNWLSIESNPETISWAQLAGRIESVALTKENKRLPWFQHQDKLCGFASSSDLRANFGNTPPTVLGGQVLISQLFEAKSVNFGKIATDDVKRILVNLIRQSWDLKMESLGLLPFSMANNMPVRFIPQDLVPGNKVIFADVSGKTRKKNLVGRSDKRKVYWHFGISVHPFIGKPWRVELRSHVIFTADGKTPLFSPERMHKLRRGFCRNWWNDDFRSLLRAFLSFASSGAPTIELPASEKAKIVLSSRTLTVESNVGLSDAFDLPEDLNAVLDDSVDPDQEDDDETEEKEDLSELGKEDTP